MGSVVVLAERHVDAPADTIFALLQPGAGAGWLFDVTCDRLAPGAVISLQLPLSGLNEDGVTILGRIAHLRAPWRLDIVHDLPWRGRLRIRLDDAPSDEGGPGTRLRLLADLDDEGIAWLLRHRGVRVTEPLDPAERPVGLLLSKSGPGAVFAGACEQLAAMAVAEINADGGIRGQRLRLLVGDDATDPATGALEARRLVAAGCRTILAATTSASFARIADELQAAGVLLVHTLMNEGGLGSELRMQLGERPHLQLAAATGPLMDQVGGRRWFLAGNDYVWPRVVHDAAKRVLARGGATVAGEAFAPLGTRDFTPLIERIVATQADLVLSSFVGADLVAFERQCHAMGVREHCGSLALALDEPTRERIGDAAAEGLWGVSGYFEQLDDEHNAAFLARYRGTFGGLATPVSSISEGTYEALHLYAAAARDAGEDEPRVLARTLRSCRSTFARGTVAIEGPETVVQDLFVAQAVPGGFAVDRVG
jgi:branched-chain amino acid transport system substrate-binding protein